METVAFCEFDEHARKVLKKHWPDVPIHNDVRELDGKQYRGSVDVVCGGFPCQDLSTAGKQAGFDGERSSLYREMLRIISECMPKYAIFENVTGLLSGDGGRWFARFLYDLAEVGYDAEWHCIPASELGAHHHRDRVWIIAYPTKLQRNVSIFDGKNVTAQTQEFGGCSGKDVLADSKRKRQPRSGVHGRQVYTEEDSNRKADWAVDSSERSAWSWHIEPDVGRVANGVPNRSHRLKQLGNAVVPQIPELIGRAIMQVEANS